MSLFKISILVIVLGCFSFNWAGGDTSLNLNPGQPSLSISRTLINQELIWSRWVEKSEATLYPTIGSALSSPRVVLRLDASGKRLLVIRSNQSGGQILGQMPVLSESRDSLIVDLSAEALPLKDEVFNLAVPIENSNIEKAAYGNSHMTFAQVLRIRDSLHSQMVLRHEFRLVSNSPYFSALALPEPLRKGLQPANWSAALSRPAATATVRRWDLSSPIIWRIHPTVPSELRESVREGLLWWNAAFPQTPIVVRTEGDFDWAHPGVNAVYWTTKESCGVGPAAYASTSADEVSGQILAAKIIVCGFETAEAYYKDLGSTSLSKPEFYKLYFRDLIAHEVGHTFALGHNFKGKLYRDHLRPALMTSSVMDYLRGEERIRVNSIGPLDVAWMDYLYIRPGSAEAWSQVQAFPACVGDFDEASDADCTGEMRGGRHAPELLAWYVDQLQSGSTEVRPSEQFTMSNVALKLILTASDVPLLRLASKLFRQIGKVKLAGAATVYGPKNAEHFLQLPEEYRKQVLDLFREALIDPAVSEPLRQQLRAVIAILSGKGNET